MPPFLPLLCHCRPFDRKTRKRYKVVIPCPSKNVEKIYPVEVLGQGIDLPKPTKFQADSIFTISRDELGERIGRLPAPVMDRISQALRLELDL